MSEPRSESRLGACSTAGHLLHRWILLCNRDSSCFRYGKTQRPRIPVGSPRPRDEPVSVRSQPVPPRGGTPPAGTRWVMDTPIPCVIGAPEPPSPETLVGPKTLCP